MSFDLKTAIGAVAPTLAGMLGGPLAGAAVSALAAAFGLAPGAGAADITKVLQTGAMTPDVIAAVRAADQKHAEILGQQGLDLQKLNADTIAAVARIDADDRASARGREIAVRGWTTPALAWLVVGASMGLGVAVVGGYVTKDPTQATLVGTVLGYVFSEAKAVLSYFFGSSQGSASKDILLAQSTPRV